jgi:dTMP kinase
MDWILTLEFNHFAIPKPDINIFLDVPFAFTEKNLTKTRTGIDRSYLNGTRDIHEESMIFQKKVRDIYLRVSGSDDHLAVIDCSNSNGAMLTPSEIFDLIINVFNKRKLI